MIDHAQPTLSSAAASLHGAATHALELLEARQQRDALKALLRNEQAAMADFLVALADFDRRRGWEPLGHANLFAFIRVELGLSRSGAYWRVSAARLVQRFPEVIVPLRDGRLCMSTTAELAKVLTEENQAEVLPRFFGLSAREAQEVTAELAPRRELPARDLVTRVEKDRGLQLVQPAVSAPEPLPTPSPTVMAGPTGESVQTFGLLPAHLARIAALPIREDVEPFTADLRRLHITVSREFLRDLETARDGLSHAFPNATTERVLQEALRLLLEKQAKARGQVMRPRRGAPSTTAATATIVSSAAIPCMPSTQIAAATLLETPTSAEPSTSTPLSAPAETTAMDSAAPSPDSTVTEPFHRRIGPRETIPAAVRRAVWARDGGRCTWPLDSGGRCGSTHRLELDHVHPWAREGEPTVANLRVVCHAHNALAARREFGARCVERYAVTRLR